MPVSITIPDNKETKLVKKLKNKYPNLDFVYKIGFQHSTVGVKAKVLLEKDGIKEERMIGIPAYTSEICEEVFEDLVKRLYKSAEEGKLERSHLEVNDNDEFYEVHDGYIHYDKITIL